MNVRFITLGCKVNQYETEAMREILLKRGYTEDENAPADVLIVNSCTVTGEGDRKTKKLFEKAKRENLGCITVFCGCFPQAFPEKAGEVPADVVTGTKNRGDIASLIEKAKTEKRKIIEITPHKVKEEIEDLRVSSFEGHTRAFMKIQDGCDRYCSYCIIPYARGHLRSKSIEAIKEEAVCLSENGYKEVVLTGINLSYFGKGMGLDIGDAVLAVAEVEGIERIRLGSLQPDLISDGIIEKFVRAEKLCPQFHLSLQSGSSSVLRRMNRPYTAEVFSDVVKRLRRAFPELSVTTDIIVGFPGETNEEFLETAKFIKDIGFSKIHIFPYSKRSGTPAAEMECQVPETLKNERKKALSEIAEKIREEEMNKLIGNTVRVLVEKKGEGYSENYTPVVFRSDAKTGEIINAKIIKIKNGKAEGEIV